MTLSSAQLEACRKHGLEAHLQDAREVTRDTFGPFDAAVSLGAFEHFASPEDYEAGRQDAVYERFFANVATVLPDGGRFYLQTMVFGPNMIPIEQVDRNAPRDSDAWYLAMMQAAFPGSFLPFGKETGDPVRRAALQAGVGGQRSSGLHPDDQGVGQAHRGVDARGWRCSSCG